MFPDAKFSIGLPIEEMNEILTDKKQIIVKHTFTCYCWDNQPKVPVYYHIKCEVMSIKNILQELIRQDTQEYYCNHNHLEGIDETKDSDCQWELFFAS